MIYLKILFGVIALLCILFFIFHPKDVLGFWVVVIKKVYLGIYNIIRSWIK